MYEEDGYDKSKGDRRKFLDHWTVRYHISTLVNYF